MRPAPVLVAAFFVVALLAPVAASAGCPAKAADCAATVCCVKPDPACCPTSAPSVSTGGLYVREVPLSQAGDWAVAPKLSRRLVQVSPGVFVALKGEHERRHARVARWIEGLRGAPLAVFKEAGMPVYRHRELTQDRLYEVWTYPERHVTYVFEGDRLIRTQSF